MKTVKRPVSVAGIEFDALMNEEKSYEAEVPEYSVEDGYSVSDSIIRAPLLLTMTLAVTDTPVTWKSRFSNTQDRVDTICKQLEELYNKAEPVTVITSTDTYRNMAIASITLTKDEQGRYYREIPITFKQIVVTKAKTTTIPASYYRSGKSSAPAGNANTSSGSTKSSSSSSSSSSSKSSSSSSSKKEESKGSILYNAAKSLGIIGGSKSNKNGKNTRKDMEA